MSIRQSNLSEIRYLKRKNLQEEAKIVGNYYRDIIRSYGVDCSYRKLDTSDFNNYNGIVDQNAILKYAYGYPIIKDYSLSARMLTYMEVEADIFQLNKYGLVPDMTTNFYFDKTDFACALCEKLGQYKEYPINETEIMCEVPIIGDDEINSYMFPHRLGLGYNEVFISDVLSGKLSVEIEPYEYNKEYTVICHPYEHGDFKHSFPSNEYLYKSMLHKLKNEEYVNSMIRLTYKVTKKMVNPSGKTEKERYIAILKGKISGTILFYDLNSIGKYLTKIAPAVGDIVKIDFPDEENGEQYEITDCYDKQLTPDGISPLLHNYIWKCKARRYINSYEDNPDEGLGDKKFDEKQRFDQLVESDISERISFYPDKEDRVYGGYDNNIDEYDNMKPERYDKNMNDRQKFEYLDDGTALDIIRFGCGSRLLTDGYELLFMTKSGDFYKIASYDTPSASESYFHTNLRFLKCSKNRLVFVNVSGESYTICKVDQATPYEIDLNSLYDSTLDDGENINKEGDNFYKFKESRSYLFATEDHLYCKLENDKEDGLHLII